MLESRKISADRVSAHYGFLVRRRLVAEWEQPEVYTGLSEVLTDLHGAAIVSFLEKLQVVGQRLHVQSLTPFVDMLGILERRDEHAFRIETDLAAVALLSRESKLDAVIEQSVGIPLPRRFESPPWGPVSG